MKANNNQKAKHATALELLKIMMETSLFEREHTIKYIKKTMFSSSILEIIFLATLIKVVFQGYYNGIPHWSYWFFVFFYALGAILTIREINLARKELNILRKGIKDTTDMGFSTPTAKDVNVRVEKLLNEKGVIDD